MLLFNSHCKTSYTLYQFFFFLIPAHGTFKKKKKINDTLFCNWYFYTII